MNRKNFIQQCAKTCLSSAVLGGGFAVASGLTGCATSKGAASSIIGDDLVIPLAAFRIGDAGSGRFKPSVIVHPEILKFPICVYRFSDEQYSAVWMQCTHQGAELQAFGPTLQCPAHGSEFNNKGEVTSGPANAPLRSFPVRIGNDELKISLKAV